MARGTIRWVAALVVTFVVTVVAGAAPAEDGGDLRELRVGMSIGDIPADRYVDLRCAAAPEKMLGSWQQFQQCPPDTNGLRVVSFRFNEDLNPRVRLNDKYEGTKVAGHPVLLAIAIDERGTVGRLRIDSDPKARLFLRKKAHLLALVVRARFGDEGWSCRDKPPAGGETPVGGVFVDEHCEKIADGRTFSLDRAVYRRPGQSTSEFVNETHLEIRLLAGNSKSGGEQP